jgi:serine/threonine protein kinase/WD40 repeat protein
MPDNSPKFESIVKKILLAEERGERPDPKQYAESFPELAGQLSKYFRNRDWFAAEAPHVAPTPIQRATVNEDPAAGIAFPSLTPGCRFAGHEIIELVGRGGMGDVYKARQLDPDRLVALKVIRVDRLEALSEEQRVRWIKRFRREARMIASIDQPAQIVTVYQVGEWRPKKAAAAVPFFTMRFMDGGTLAQVVSSGRQQPGSPQNQIWAARMVAGAARAVHRAHQAGIFHRDLKPANILLDAEGQPLVSDFGLALRLDETSSLVESGIEGTAAYMAPEQAAQRTVSAATDVYSLGAILYELLTGQVPFHGKSTFETLLLVARQPPIPPRRLEPRLSRDLETICLKCLEKAPAERYSSAKELADDIDRWQAGRPIKARPVGNLGRLYRWCRRNPTLAAVSTAAILAVVLSGAIYAAYASVNWDKQVVQKDKDRLTEENKEQERIIAAKELENAIPNVPQQIEGGEHNDAIKTLAKWKPILKDDIRPPWEVSFLKAQLQDKAFSVREHSGEVVAVALNPEGTQIASADQDGNIILWNLTDNKKVRDLHIKKGHVFALAWGPDGKKLAVAGGEAAIEFALPIPVNPVPNGGLPPVPNSKPPKGKVPGSKTANGKPEVKPGGEALVQIWDLATNKESILNLKSKIAFQPGIASLMWSPSGEKLAIAGSDGAVLVNEPGAKESRALRGHTAAIHSLAWSPEGNRLASASGDGTIKVWDVAKGKEASSWPLPGNPLMLGPVSSFGTTWAIAWTADGKLVRAVGPNAQLTSWDAITGKDNPLSQLAPRDFGWLPGQRSRFTWRPDGKMFASAVAGQIRIWDGATGQEVHKCPSPAEQSFMSFVQCAPAWDQKGRWVSLGRSNGSVHAWPVGLKRPSVRSPVPNAQGWSHDSRGLLCKPWAPLGTVPGLVETPEMKETFEALKRAAQAGGLTPPDPKAIVGGPDGQRRTQPNSEPQVQF